MTHLATEPITEGDEVVALQLGCGGQSPNDENNKYYEWDASKVRKLLTCPGCQEAVDKITEEHPTIGQRMPFIIVNEESHARRYPHGRRG